MAAGTVFINPTFRTRKLDFFDSQHPYLAKAVGPPYVCDANLDDADAVVACVQAALAVDLPPRIPEEMTPDAYLARLRRLIVPALQISELRRED